MSDLVSSEGRLRRFDLCAGLASLFWFVVLASGYDLGQILYGLRILVSDVPHESDVARGLAHSGIAALTVWVVQLAGFAGMVGSAGFLLRRGWSLIALVAGAVCLVWPILVWGVALTFWTALDPRGAGVMAVHTALTASVGFGMPLLAYVRH